MKNTIFLIFSLLYSNSGIGAPVHFIEEIDILNPPSVFTLCKAIQLDWTFEWARSGFHKVGS